jgi:hypothetical protein
MIAAILVMIALFYTTPNDFNGVDHGLFLPDLKAGINDVDKITITTANNELVATLQRGEAQWTVVERYGFPANVGKIRSILIALADAQIIETKTADPALYDRLGVQDLDQPDASGTRIDISGPGQTISLIVGDTGVRGDMAYVRQVGADQSFLVSADLDLGSNIADWIDKDLLNISPSNVHTVTINHPDGDSLSIEKINREATGFTVVEVPEGRELSYASIADPIGGVLTALTMDDVTTLTALDLGASEPVVTRFETFDGLVIEVDAYHLLDDDIKVRFRISADQALADEFIDTDAETTDPAFSSTVAKAEELNAKLEPWIFTLPSFKSDQLVKRMEDLLK